MAKSPRPTAAQDPSIADTSRGVSVALGALKSEDERRAEGTDASQAEGAGEHDDSPEASRGQQPGGTVLDAYANSAGSLHDNRSSPGPELVLGQAPSSPTHPMKGSKAYGEKFHPEIPNAMNRSPMIVGPDADGKPVQAKTFEDLKAELPDPADEKAGETLEAEKAA